MHYPTRGYTDAGTATPTYPMAGVGGNQPPANGGSEPPKKYIKENGVMKLNPAWKAWKEAQGQPATTALNPDQALPVASNMDDYFQMQETSMEMGYGDVPMAPNMESTVEIMQDPDNCRRVGISSDAMLDNLGRVFAKHEAPMGLMNKLLMLTEFDELEFIVDDSGSMSMQSDTKDQHGRYQTRWEEVRMRLKEMVEILAYVPSPPLHIHFLNRRDPIKVQRSGETPEIFMNNVYGQIDRAFMRGPSGGTPVRECLEASFKAGFQRRVARYLFCDGCPNGGQRSIDAITQLAKNRPDPEGNPLTFLSCTNEDDQVEWMKEAEEVAPYCAEYDDFEDEAREVMRDQGDVLPFTKGFHLIGQLVGAMNPDDLDAMDESAPFTKFTLDNLLGVQMTEPEYRRYWDGFKRAQQNRRIETKLDQMKKAQNWDPYYNQFLTAQLAREIPAVQDFKRRLGS